MAETIYVSTLEVENVGVVVVYAGSDQELAKERISEKFLPFLKTSYGDKILERYIKVWIDGEVIGTIESE